MSKVTPTQRSLAWLKANGYMAVKVEHWNAFAKIRQDLLGCGDLLALKPEEGGPLLVQVTSTSNLSSRQHKALELPALKLWLACGARFELHGWALRGPRGTKKTWTLARRIVLADLSVKECEV